MAAARIVEVVPRPIRTPVVKYPHKTPALEVRLREILGHIGEPEASQGCIEHRNDTIDDDLTLHSDLELVTVSFEIPSPDPTMGWKAHVDARVAE